MNLDNIRYRIKLLDALSAAYVMASKTLVLYMYKGTGRYNLVEKENFFPDGRVSDITEVCFMNNQFSIGYRQNENQTLNLSKLNISTDKKYSIGALRCGKYVTA